jgi:alpha-amylase
MTSRVRHTHFTAVLALALLLCTGPANAQTDTTYWWNDCTFYEVFVRSFKDSNGDGIGDIAGIIQKLDYLKDLGVRGLWLMPITPSPSYHGYDVTDYRNIEPDYGSMPHFQALIQAAHERGIRVIIDLVMNHTSSDHPWFIQSASGSGSPLRDWYIWQNTNPGYTGPWGQQVWHLRNGAYYFGLFWSGMPDLNFYNPDVQNAMFDVSRFWIDTVGVDGFRLDAIKHLCENGTVMQDVPATFTFLRNFRQFYKSVNPDAMAVGEVWSATSQVAPYADGTGIDFCFEFDLGYSTISGVNTGNPLYVSNKMTEVVSTYRPLQYAPFLTNHDQDRVFTQFGSDVTKMKLAAAVYLTLPGIPFVYYGEEVGMTGSGSDPNKRTPMQWTAGANAGFTTGVPWYAVNSNYPTNNVTVMQADSASLWHWYRRLIQLRNEQPVLRRGDYVQISTGSSVVYAYARRTAEQIVVVVHNVGTSAVTSPTLTLSSSFLIPGTYDVRSLLAGPDPGTVTLNASGGFAVWQPSVSIAAKATVIFGISTTTAAQSVGAGWNLLSLPLDPDDPRFSVNYPAAASPAYSYSSVGGYASSDSGRTGRGYWVKFPASGSVAIHGGLSREDTVDVEPGWNLLGSLSVPLPASGVRSLPPGIITSGFFGYGAGGTYVTNDTLMPGCGYWVKTGGSGRVVLKK